MSFLVQHSKCITDSLNHHLTVLQLTWKGCGLLKLKSRQDLVHTLSSGSSFGFTED